jgi:GNAT superfamily N-acetyltransferase
MVVSEPDPAPLLRLDPGDAEGLWPLSVAAGWNQIVADWRLMIAGGVAFGVRGAHQAWVASALAFPLGAAIWWISMVLVRKAERGRGLGTRLLARCVAEIEAHGAAMGLDATEFGRPIYLPLGFRDVYQLSRWSAGRGARRAVCPPPGVALRAATTQDLAMIAGYDSPRSGFERSRVLANLIAREPRLAYLAQRAGEVAGYVLAREGHRATHIGPVVAEDEAIGLALLSRAMAGVDGDMIVDVPEGHDAIKRWLSSQGALTARRFTRMLRGPAPDVADPTRIFALAGPELG